MKRLFTILIAAVIMLSICSCAKTSVNRNANVALTFIYGEENIGVTLEDDEAERIIDILDGNNYYSIFSGIPSCGFDKNISLSVGNRVFAIACDSCHCIQDLSNLKYFSIAQEDMEYIHSLFEKYGGFFPCV